MHTILSVTVLEIMCLKGKMRRREKERVREGRKSIYNRTMLRVSGWEGNYEHCWQEMYTVDGMVLEYCMTEI